MAVILQVLHLVMQVVLVAVPHKVVVFQGQVVLEIHPLYLLHKVVMAEQEGVFQDMEAAVAVEQLLSV